MAHTEASSCSPSSSSDLWERLHKQQLSVCLTSDPSPPDSHVRSVILTGSVALQCPLWVGARKEAECPGEWHGEVGPVPREGVAPCFGGQLSAHVVVAACSQTFLICRRGPRFGYLRKRHWHIFRKHVLAVLDSMEGWGRGAAGVAGSREPFCPKGWLLCQGNKWYGNSRFHDEGVSEAPDRHPQLGWSPGPACSCQAL